MQQTVITESNKYAVISVMGGQGIQIQDKADELTTPLMLGQEAIDERRALRYANEKVGTFLFDDLCHDHFMAGKTVYDEHNQEVAL